MANTPTEPSINLEAMIAEAAYYKAEKRNFYPGHEIRDWLEAKMEWNFSVLLFSWVYVATYFNNKTHIIYLFIRYKHLIISFY